MGSMLYFENLGDVLILSFHPPIILKLYLHIHYIARTGDYHKKVLIPIVFDIQMNSIQHPLLNTSITVQRMTLYIWRSILKQRQTKM